MINEYYLSSRNITSEDFSRLSQLLDALNRPVFLDSPSSEEEVDFNEDYIDPDSESMLDETELCDSASYKTESDVASTSSAISSTDISSQEDLDFEFLTAIRDLRLLASSSFMPVHVEKDPVIPEKELPSNKEISETHSVERINVQRINVENQSSVFSGEELEESPIDQPLIENDTCDSLRQVELCLESRTSDTEGPKTREEESSPNREEQKPSDPFAVPIVIKQAGFPAVAEKVSIFYCLKKSCCPLG